VGGLGCGGVNYSQKKGYLGLKETWGCLRPKLGAEERKFNESVMKSPD
jgi:hypothetical protein